MNEFRTDTFKGFEQQIRAARQTRSAVIGEAIGTWLAEAWFGLQRLGTRLEHAFAASRTARKGRVVTPRHLTSRPRASTTH